MNGFCGKNCDNCSHKKVLNCEGCDSCTDSMCSIKACGTEKNIKGCTSCSDKDYCLLYGKRSKVPGERKEALENDEVDVEGYSEDKNDLMMLQHKVSLRTKVELISIVVFALISLILPGHMAEYAIILAIGVALFVSLISDKERQREYFVAAMFSSSLIVFGALYIIIFLLISMHIVPSSVENTLAVLMIIILPIVQVILIYNVSYQLNKAYVMELLDYDCELSLKKISITSFVAGVLMLRSVMEAIQFQELSGFGGVIGCILFAVNIIRRNVLVNDAIYMIMKKSS